MSQLARALILIRKLRRRIEVLEKEKETGRRSRMTAHKAAVLRLSSPDLEEGP